MFHGLLMPFFEEYIDLENIYNKTNSVILTLLIHYFFTIGITFILAFFSWEFFEKRILILKKYFSN